MINSYIALDLETTGLNPKYSRILEVGAAKVTDGKITDTYSTIVNAKVMLSEDIVKLTGITGEMMSQGRNIEEVITELVEFCEDYILLGHNIIFDYSFVKKAAVNNKLVFEKEAVDTLKLARRFLPEFPKKTLEYLTNHYNIKHENKHRAYDDAIASSELYKILCSEFYEKDSAAFKPYRLNYQVKREGPVTQRQKNHLNDLIKYHRIDLAVQIDSLTKNEASRIIDKIILEYGKII